MVINDNQLNLIFGALSDETRRHMLMRLSGGDMNIKTLAEPYKMSQPAISKHVRVLERAGLVEKTQQGRESIIRANPTLVQHAGDWIAYYMQFWQEQFDAVEAHLQHNKDDTNE